ncbi:unnamed protein product [Alternaria alternata]
MQRLEKEAQKYPYKSWEPSDKRWLELWCTVGNAHENLVLQQRKGLESILSRPWFQRIWITQEVSKARAAEVACGLKTVSAPIFVVTLSLVGVTPDSHGQAVLGLMSGLEQEYSWSTKDPDLRKTLLNYEESQVADSRNKSDGMLGLWSHEHTVELVPDYSKTPAGSIQDAIAAVLGFDVGWKSTCRLPEWDVSVLYENVPLLVDKVSRWAIRERQFITLEAIMHRHKVQLVGNRFGSGSLLWDPILDHDTEMVKLLLEKGTDVDFRNEDWNNALLVALKYGHNQTAKLLLEKLIKVDSNILHLAELLPGSGDISDLLSGKSGDGFQVASTDDTTSSTKNSHTFVNSTSDREAYDDMTKVDLGESYRVLDNSAQQQRFEDVDIRSLISEEDDAASSISVPLPSWASETEHTIVGVFANSSALSPLYSKALQLMPQERCINNFRRLLKAFHGNLVASDNSIVTRQLAKLLKSKQRQSRIARRIMVRHVALQGCWNEKDLAAIRDQEKQAFTNVENWLDMTITDTQAARSANTSEELESDDESGTESDEEDEISHFAQYPRLDLVIQKLVEGRPFQDMLTSFKELLLPPGLLKELLPIPRDNITYGTTEETGLLSTVQEFLEEITALEWDWWPLSPRMRPLKPSETRVQWKCFCGMHRWRELRMEQQEILDELLKQSSADNHPRPLCALLRDTRSASYMKTFSLSQHAASQPHQNASPNTHIPASTNAAPPSLGTQAMRSQPGSNAASQAGGNGPVQPTSASTSSSQTSSGNNSAYNKQLWVNFGVDGSWTPTELDQLGGLNLVSDSTFLRNLGRRHREIRGWFRHYFSFRIISYWEFLRFKRLPLLPPQTIDVEADLPTSSDYEYDPRPPLATRDKPGITKHEFEVYVQLCLNPCWLSSLLMPHKCRTVEDSAVDIVDKIPKYKKLLEQRTQGDEHVWGIRARYVVSGIRVVALHIAILCISFGVWIWWQWKHPDDLQGAAVALTAAFLLISTFWSATGVLRDLR